MNLLPTNAQVRPIAGAGGDGKVDGFAGEVAHVLVEGLTGTAPTGPTPLLGCYVCFGPCDAHTGSGRHGLRAGFLSDHSGRE
jgi:hypothetical protein